MFAAQKVITISRATGRFLVPSRTTISTPPRVRVSFPEKAAHGFLMLFCFLATPAYIATHIKYYRGASE